MECQTRVCSWNNLTEQTNQTMYNQALLLCKPFLRGRGSSTSEKWLSNKLCQVCTGIVPTCSLWDPPSSEVRTVQLFIVLNFAASDQYIRPFQKGVQLSALCIKISCNFERCWANLWFESLKCKQCCIKCVCVQYNIRVQNIHCGSSLD